MNEKTKIRVAVIFAVVLCITIGGTAIFWRYGGAVDLGDHVLLRDDLNDPHIFSTDAESLTEIVVYKDTPRENLCSIKYTPYLNKFKNLKTLLLDIYDDMDTENIDLSGLSSLEELDIHINRGNYSTDRIYISGFSPRYDKLGFFTVLNFANVTVSFEGVTADMFPCLETVMITDDNGGFDGISSLAGISSVRSLSLGTVNDIPLGSAPLSGLTECEDLFLVGVRIDDVSQIVNMPAIEKITVSESRISEEDIQMLRDNGIEVEVIQKRGK